MYIVMFMWFSDRIPSHSKIKSGIYIHERPVLQIRIRSDKNYFVTLTKQLGSCPTFFYF